MFKKFDASVMAISNKAWLRFNLVFAVVCLVGSLLMVSSTYYGDSVGGLLNDAHKHYVADEK